jgi:hypothetical protein
MQPGLRTCRYGKSDEVGHWIHREISEYPHNNTYDPTRLAWIKPWQDPDLWICPVNPHLLDVHLVYWHLFPLFIYGVDQQQPINGGLPTH